MIWLLALVLNVALTPGLWTPMTHAQLCGTKWGHDRRHVTAAIKQQVERAYGVRVVRPYGRGPCCEIDHRVPRELGGQDDVRNLWPEPWADAKRKDRLENQLHAAVCRGDMTQEQAVRRILQWEGPQ